MRSITGLAVTRMVPDTWRGGVVSMGAQSSDGTAGPGGDADGAAAGMGEALGAVASACGEASGRDVRQQ